jgi:diguanylate cyclase (GGDEF)-like protein
VSSVTSSHASVSLALAYDRRMRDPRLVEIDFLMDLEQEEQLTIIGHGAKENDYVFPGAAARRNIGKTTELYGTDPKRFSQMVHYLLGERLITNPDGIWGVWGLAEDEKIPVHMSHAGRVHLWNLRDALLRDHDLDAFGFRVRAAWDRELFVQLRWARPEAPLSVMFLDLDHFKRVNDQHGHPVGDKVLRATGQLIHSVVGVRGGIYRYGGEEIGVLLPETNLDEATRMAEEIRAFIEREVHVMVTELTVPQTASIGVKSFTSIVDDLAAIKAVDELMYKAKHNGRNRVECPT